MADMNAMARAAEAIDQLGADGVTTVIGTVVNSAGLIHAKTIPLQRLGAFADSGLGASPVWHVFTIDQTGIVFGDSTGVVGDERIRIDLDGLRNLGDGLAWAPGDFFHQDGSRDMHCSRGALSRMQTRLSDRGIEALIGHEMEFVLVGPGGESLPSHLWAQYGLAGVLEYEGFVRDVTDAAAAAGVDIEQFHPEYGINQFEISLAPQKPVAAADELVLIRIIAGRVARRYGMRVSLSPIPFAGGVGSGAHQHFSLTHDGSPLFGGGAGPAVMTADGAAAVAGLLAGLRQAQGVLGGSILSGLRMRPGYWSGANICWGTENREAAVRFLLEGPANPRGGNVEVKVIDPSANPYLASATILGLALDGIDRALALPEQITVDPASLSEAQRSAAGVGLLTPDQSETIDALDRSSLVRGILGDEVVDAVVAVRRYERDNYADLSPEDLAEKFRLAWSV